MGGIYWCGCKEVAYAANYRHLSVPQFVAQPRNVVSPPLFLPQELRSLLNNANYS